MFPDLFLGLRVPGALGVLFPGIFELIILFSITVAVVGFIPRTFFLLGFRLYHFGTDYLNLAKNVLRSNLLRVVRVLGNAPRRRATVYAI